MKRSLFGSLAIGLVAGALGCSNSDSGGSGAGAGAPSNGGQPSGAGAGPSNAGAAGSSPNGGSGNPGAGAGNPGAGSGGTGNPGAGAGGASGAGTAGSAPTAGAGGGLGPFTGIDFGAVSDGGTVTYSNIGKAGSYPSVCAPNGNMCCRQTKTIAGDKLTPWDQDLIMTLRGPLDIKQFATYQPTTEGSPSPWKLVSSWDVRKPDAGKGIAFTGNAAPNTKFKGSIGSVCLVNASTDKAFGCGPASSPYCNANSENKYTGWAGSKLFVVLASAPHVGSGAITTAQSCADNGWTDAPWFGISVGELIRAGAFSNCNCYESTLYQGNGCGQINAMEVINDKNAYTNLEVFSSNFFSYGGVFGGPCPTCKPNTLGANVDLVTPSGAATSGATGSQGMGANAWLRRPSTGFRYFVFLLDVSSRTVQYAIIHPSKVPAGLAGLLPALPDSVPQASIDNLLALRLPK